MSIKNPLSVCRLHLVVAAMLLTGLFVALGHFGTEPARADVTQPAELVEVTEASLTWGMRASWRNYAGQGTMSEGVTANGAGEYNWPVVGGTFDPDTNRLEIQASGKVHWDLHGGALDITFSNPRLVIEGDQPQLWVEAISREIDGDREMVDFGLVPVANLDLALADPTTEDSVTTWSPIPANLTQVGSAIFGHEYSVGAALDPIRLTYRGPGGKPVPTQDVWDEQGVPGYELAEIAHPEWLGGSTEMLMDVDRNLVHVIRNTGGGWRATAVDATTLEPVGETIALPSFYQQQDPLALHPGTGDVFYMTTSSQVGILHWNPEDGGYTHSTVVTGSNIWIVAHDGADGRDRMLVPRADGITIFEPDPLASTGWSIRTYPGARLSTTNTKIAALSDTELVITNYTFGVEKVTINRENGSSSLSAFPGNFADPNSEFAGTFDKPGYLHRTQDGFVLADWLGGYTRIGWAEGAWTQEGGHQAGPVGSLYRSQFDDQNQVLLTHSYSSGALGIWRDGKTARLNVPGLSRTGFAAGDGEFLALVDSNGDPTKNGVYRYRYIGTTPVVAAVPESVVVSLDFGETAKPASLAVDIAGAESYQWQTRPAGQSKFEPIEGGDESTLEWNATSLDHGREFRAIAANTVGRIVTEPIKLEVNWAPRIAQDVQAVGVLAGEDALFKLMPSGNPAPEVTWQRQINGFWQNIHAASGDFEIDGETGGFLTVKNADLAMNGNRFRVRLRNKITPGSDQWSTTYSSAVALTVSSPVTEPLTFSGGHLDWGVYKRWRCYISTAYNAAAGDCPLTAIAAGQYSTAAGATEPVSGVFRFPSTGGSYDPASGEVELHFRGSVNFYGHHGVIDTTYSNLKIAGDGEETYLYADARYLEGDMGSTEPGDVVEEQDVRLVAVDLPDPVATEDGVIFAEAPTLLHPDGVHLFSGYTEGTAFDPLGLSLVEGPWDQDVDPDPEPADPEITPEKVKRLKQKTSFAVLLCPETAESGCSISVPEKVKLKAAGKLTKSQKKQIAKRVKIAGGGKGLATGKRQHLILKLTPAQRKVLKGKKLTGKVRISITAGDRTVAKTVQVSAKVR